MINKKISIVTVTFNNAENLERTLRSIVDCPTFPFEVIVIDGGSTDNTKKIIDLYSGKITINFTSEPDFGIYDGMNKGQKKTKTDLIHYLNAGDCVSGDPYSNVMSPCVLPVKITDNKTGKSWFDKIKLIGYGYCHQGIIFPAKHSPYNTSYRFGADFHAVAKTFADGLHDLSIHDDGIVHYNLDGISSRKFPLMLAIEILRAAWSALPFIKWIAILFILVGKSMVPRVVRRYVASLFFIRSN
jgi:glycosyltransferase involved in cell wall biosynthesis